MEETNLPHKGQETHLCFLKHMGFLTENPELYKNMVRNPKYICRTCGRASQKEEYLCNPEKL